MGKKIKNSSLHYSFLSLSSFSCSPSFFFFIIKFLLFILLLPDGLSLPSNVKVICGNCAAAPDGSCTHQYTNPNPSTGWWFVYYTSDKSTAVCSYTKDATTPSWTTITPPGLTTNCGGTCWWEVMESHSGCDDGLSVDKLSYGTKNGKWTVTRADGSQYTTFMDFTNSDIASDENSLGVYSSDISPISLVNISAPKDAGLWSYVQFEARTPPAYTKTFAYGGHYYEYFAGSYQWNFALTYAFQKQRNNRQGFLSAITTSAEAAGIKSGLGSSYSTIVIWVGGSDGETEGVWKWMDGPEKGVQFGTSTGASVGGLYSSWNSGNPSSTSTADCAQFDVSSTKFISAGCFNGNTKGFLVEYLGIQQCLNNECSSLNNPGNTCQDFGNETYACTCKQAGYQAAADKKSCIGVQQCKSDECRTSYFSSNICTDNGIGGYSCTCANPWKQGPSGLSCIGPDLCPTAPCYTTYSGNNCTNTQNGTYYCTCKAAGWNTTNVTSIGAQACKGPPQCGIISNYCNYTQNNNNRCVDNGDNTYSCSCYSPYYTRPLGSTTTCVDVDECASSYTCHPAATCVNSVGSFSCTCNAGYSGNGTSCSLFNACVSANPCFNGSQCNDLPPPSMTATCGPCPVGYTGNGYANNCTKQSYCAVNNPCWPGVTCTDRADIFGATCGNCPNGLSGDGITCNDVDECKSGTLNTCNPPTICVNTPGSYLCPPSIAHTLSLSGVPAASPLILNNMKGGQSLTFSVTGGSGNYTVNTSTIVYGFSDKSFLFPCNFLNMGGPNTFICQTTAGAGINLNLWVDIYSNSAVTTITINPPLNPYDTISYPPPTIADNTIRLGSSPTPVPTVGFVSAQNSLGDSIRFDGTNFINDTNFIKIGYGPAGNPFLYPCTLAPLQSNATTITCYTSPNSADPSTKLYFSVNVSGQIATGNDYYFAIPVPVIVRVSGCTNQDNITYDCPTQGDVDIVVEGTNGEYGPKTAVLISGRPCPVVSFTTNNITCKLGSGTGLNRTVMVLVNNRYTSPLLGISYAAPTITSVIGCSPGSSPIHIIDCDRNGGGILTLNGQNFGASGAFVLIGGQPCLNVTHDIRIPHQSLTCIYPNGTVQNAHIILFQLEGIFSTSTATFSYAQCQSGQAVNGTSCPNCSTGKFSDYKGAEKCRDCEAGTMANVSGASSCLTCGIGYFSIHGSPTCQACIPGTYSANSGQSQCFQCTSGRYINESAASTCDSCDAGTSQNNTGALECIKCLPGFFRATPGATNCIPCQPGTIADINGSLTCTQCPIGTYMDQPAASACLNCSAGYYSNIPGRPECLPCDAGRFTSVSGARTCINCMAGYYSPTSGTTRCVECLLGFYTDASSQAQCTQCPVGRYTSVNATNVSCTPCTVGFYAAGSGSTTCDSCYMGSYTDASNQAICKFCPAGRYNVNASASTCDECEPGLFQSLVSQTDCSACSIGFYTSTKGRASCTPCSAGSYNINASSSSCLTCQPGFVQSGYGESSCEECQAGFYQSVSGASDCLSCLGGTFSNISSQSSCTNCAPGYWSTGGSVCEECDVGRYNNIPGAEGCELCAPGYFLNSTASTGCEQCGPGYYQPAQGQPNCAACTNGTFMDVSHSTVCIQCFPGRYINTENSTSCNACEAGYYQIFPGKTDCIKCAPGLFSDQGQFSCTPCQALTYAENEAATGCETCALGTVPNDKHTSCECPPNTFGPPLENSSQPCRSCPTGGECRDKGVVLETIVSANGWWRGSNTSTVFYQCLQASHCPGSNRLASVDECAPHRVGPICSVCETGYRQNLGSQACTKCPAYGGAMAITVIVSIIIIAGLSVLYYLVLRLGDKSYNDAKQMLTKRKSIVLELHDIEYHPEHTTRADLLILEKRPFTYSIKIIISFLQIATSLVYILDLPWPSTYSEFISAFSFMNFDFIPWPALQCVNNSIDFYWRLYVITITPVAVLICIGIFFWVPTLYLERFDMSDTETLKLRLKKLRLQCARLMLFTLFLIYPGVSSKVISFFLCRQVDGVWYLVPDFSKNCYDSQWNSHLGFAIVMILVYPVGVPLLFLVLLTLYRDRLKDPEVRFWLGFFYDGYNIRVFWFELVELMYKLLITSVIVFFPRAFILPIGLIIVTGYTAIILVLLPFLSPKDDRLQMFAQAVVFILLITQQTLDFEGAPSPGDYIDIMLSTLLITLTVCIFMLFVYHVVTGLRALTWHIKRAKHSRLVNEQSSNSQAESTNSMTPPDETEHANYTSNVSSSKSSYMIDRPETLELQSFNGPAPPSTSLKPQPPPPPPEELLATNTSDQRPIFGQIPTSSNSDFDSPPNTPPFRGHQNRNLSRA